MYKNLLTFVLILVSVFSTLLSYAVTNEVSLIQKAQPVWIAGCEKEMNLTLDFRAVFNSKTDTKTNQPVPKTAVLRIATSTLYRVFLNGHFVGSGPARAAHGYFRVDEYNINQYIRPQVVKRLTFAKATLDTPYGLIESGWHKENGKVIFKITIPVGAEAVVDLANGGVKHLTVGEYADATVQRTVAHLRLPIFKRFSVLHSVCTG
ncbi:MAG: hypothetical protein LBL62_03095 [Planctomycetaceae bacterium]|jgi:alpha-L-rhamnosidase|nr:hypothetical protein [Planctomycetaceae bacterium]